MRNRARIRTSVHWEERIDSRRMHWERLLRAKNALYKSDLNALFIFRHEDVLYLTGFRCHLGPTANLGLAAMVLPKGGDPILCTLDIDHAVARMP